MHINQGWLGGKEGEKFIGSTEKKQLQIECIPSQPGLTQLYALIVWNISKFDQYINSFPFFFPLTYVVQVHNLMLLELFGFLARIGLVLCLFPSSFLPPLFQSCEEGVLVCYHLMFKSLLIFSHIQQANIHVK